MTQHPATWHTAPPLWDLALEDQALEDQTLQDQETGGPASVSPARYSRPEILRFASDAFMDELQSRLDEDPERLAELVARAETWRDEGAGWQPQESPDPISLFQPVHQRYYLVAASLVCQLPGLPDRVTDPARETLSFLVRRLAPRTAETPVDAADPATYREQAWIGDRRAGEWRSASADAPAEGEERLPLSTLVFEHEGRPRRLHLALLPVSGRELYEGAGQAFDEDAEEIDAGSAVGAIYVVRCLYERPRCRGFAPPVISRPSRPFRMASFFDPDAPVRPVSIRLPIDTTTSGLQAFGKGVSFLLSDQMKRQMAQLEGKSIEELEDGETNAPPGLDLGVIWTFSIPIITLCAFILLMVIVNLLNFFFQWLPFFRIAIPLKLKVGS